MIRQRAIRSMVKPFNYNIVNALSSLHLIVLLQLYACTRDHTRDAASRTTPFNPPINITGVVNGQQCLPVPQLVNTTDDLSILNAAFAFDTKVDGM